jgi:hypothetical protein
MIHKRHRNVLTPQTRPAKRSCHCRTTLFRHGKQALLCADTLEHELSQRVGHNPGADNSSPVGHQPSDDGVSIPSDLGERSGTGRISAVHVTAMPRIARNFLRRCYQNSRKRIAVAKRLCGSDHRVDVDNSQSTPKARAIGSVQRQGTRLRIAASQFLPSNGFGAIAARSTSSRQRTLMSILSGSERGT